MTDNATVDDGVDIPGADDKKAQPEQTLREIALTGIEAAREKDLVEEIGEDLAGEVTVEVDPLAPENKEEKAGAVKVKVDGEELDVGEDEIRDRLGLEDRKIQPSDIRNYQKHVSADRRLAQAAETRKDLDAREEAIAAKEAAFLAKAEESAATVAGSETADDDEAKSLYESLFLQDEQAGLAAIKKLMGKVPATAQAAPDISAIAQQAADLATQRMDWTAAQQEFAKEFPDLNSDPLLAKIADNTLQETLKTSSTYSEAFHKAGDATRKWLGTVTPKPQNASSALPAADAFAEKRGKKEAAARAAVKPAGGTAGNQQEPQEESPEEIIRAMRTARGLMT